MRTLPVGGEGLGFSRDGTRLLIAGTTKLTLWELASGALVRETPLQAPLQGMAYGANADRFATWEPGGAIAVWDPATLTPRKTTVDKGAFAGALSPDGTIVAIGTESGSVVFLYDDGRRVVAATAHKQHIYDVVFSPDGMLIGTASHDGTAKLWDARSGELRATLVGHRANVTAIRFSPAGNLVGTSSADGTARLWSLDGVPLGDLDGHTNLVLELEFSRDGRRLVTASWDHRAIVWDVAGALDVRASVPVKPAVEATARIAFRGDSERAAVVGPDDTIAIVELASNRVVCRTAKRAVDQVVWSSDGRWLASQTAETREIAVWNAETCAPTRELVHPSPVIALVAGNGGDLITGTENETIQIWDLADGRVKTTYSQLPGTPFAISRDGDGLIATTFGTKTSVVLLPSRTVFDGGALPSYNVERDRTTGTVFAAGLDQRLWLWDETTKKATTLEATGPLFGVRRSPDARVVVGVGGLSPAVWDGETLLRRGTLDGHTNLAMSGGFLGDRVFVTSSADGSIRVWDTSSLQQLMVFRGASNSDVSISPDRRTVILQSGESTRIWNPRFPTPAEGLPLHFK